METDKILEFVARNPFVNHTVSSLASSFDASRPGTWKVLKKLEKEHLISLSAVGNGATSVHIVKLDLKNPLIEKIVELSLLRKALEHKRWLEKFKDLEGKSEVVLLFGSILHSAKAAEDIDIMVILKKNKVPEADGIIAKIQKTEIKKIHSSLITEEEFIEEMKRKNRAFMDAAKKGVILFGQKEFLDLLRKVEGNER